VTSEEISHEVLIVAREHREFPARVRDAIYHSLLS
jgi:hypothetical protein